MKQVHFTINVTDSKYNQLIEFLSTNFGSTKIAEEDFEVPEWHKEIVLNRIKNSKPEDYISLDGLDKEIKL